MAQSDEISNVPDVRRTEPKHFEKRQTGTKAAGVALKVKHQI
jgi:hypothetical protein